MRDLFDQITENNLELLGKKRKANKGSRLGRYALKQALGGENADYNQDDSIDNVVNLDDYRNDNDPVFEF